MRYQMFGVSFLLAAAAIGCGGDDGGGTVKVPDAKVFMDAPPPDAPPACVTPASVPAGMIGTMAMGTSGKFINKTSSGLVFFGLGVYLDQTMKTAISIIVPRPTNGFQTNTAYMFDPNPASQMPAALAYIEDGLDSTGMNAAHLLYASTGSVTFTAIGQNMGNPINGSMTSANFREVDQNTNADVPGGCTTTVAGLTFYLVQNTTIAAAAPASDAAIKWATENLDKMAIERQAP